MLWWTCSAARSRDRDVHLYTSDDGCWAEHVYCGLNIIMHHKGCVWSFMSIHTLIHIEGVLDTSSPVVRNPNPSCNSLTFNPSLKLLSTPSVTLRSFAPSYFPAMLKPGSTPSSRPAWIIPKNPAVRLLSHTKRPSPIAPVLAQLRWLSVWSKISSIQSPATHPHSSP